MIITFTRSGGFTGIPVTKTIDTKNLSQDKAKKIEELVTKSDLSSYQQNTPTKPDRFTYTINIQNDTLSGIFPLSEESVNGTIMNLIEFLESL